ncbi:hypothetical protein BH10CYA1_BH10CYA1_60200 [soil metagenome]
MSDSAYMSLLVKEAGIIGYTDKVRFSSAIMLKADSTTVIAPLDSLAGIPIRLD